MAFALPTLPYGNELFVELTEIAQRFRLRRAQLRRSPTQKPQIVHPVSQPLSLADQWSKLAAVVTGAINGAHAARTLQSAATQQLDLAQYGLTTLVDELAAVMDVQGRRARGATLHILGVGAENAGSPRGRALAA